jgi:hypothetical protein
MKIDREKIVPARQSLVGFSGEQVFPFRFIELPVMAGTYPTRKTIVVKVHGDRSTLRSQSLAREDGTDRAQSSNVNTPPKHDIHH